MTGAQSRTFPRTARLLSSAEFTRVFRNGRRHHFATMTVYAAPSQHARLGLAVPKKHIRRAVDRNRVKRVLRETFRNARHGLAPYDIVVVCRRGTDPGAVREDFQRALDGLVPGARDARRPRRRGRREGSANP